MSESKPDVLAGVAAGAARPPTSEGGLQPDDVLEIARLSNRLQQVKEELKRVRSLFYSNLVAPSPVVVAYCTRKVGPWTVSVTSTETITLDALKVMDENLKLVADQLVLYRSLAGLDK